MNFNPEKYWSTRSKKAWVVDVTSAVRTLFPNDERRLIRATTQAKAESFALRISHVQYPRVKQIRLATPDDILVSI